MADSKRQCIYLNTSILIRALEDPTVRAFLEACCQRYKCVVSNVHWREEWRSETHRLVENLLEGLGVERLEVDVAGLEEMAVDLVEERGWSAKRLIDLLHVLAAREMGCFAIAAIDRFIARRAKEYGLHYINHYTGCP